jgi:S-DNA-T family DNA segregation ATPase FtsK/SpoIIIE
MINQPIKLNPIQFFVDVGFLLYRFCQSPTGEARKLQAVITATNLVNSEGSYPVLKEVKPTPSGNQYTYTLPAGISLKEWIDRKTYFETYLNCQLEIFPPVGQPPKLVLQTHRMNFPDVIPFEFNPPPDMLVPLPIGKTPDGNSLYTDLDQLNMLVGGLPSFGKTSLLKGWTIALKMQGCEVCVIDRKRMDFPPLAKFINVAETEEEALSLIQTLLKENERRQLIVQNAGVYKVQELTDKLPYLVLIVDECAEIWTKETYQGIDTLSRLGRASGISVIMATQKPSAKLWDATFSNTRDMMSARLSFFVADYMISQLILGKGNTSACRLPMIRGRAVTVLGDRERIVQTMFLEPSKAIEILKDLKSKPYFDKLETIIPKEKPKRGRPKKKESV